jgi:type I restriction enzyme S subunit
MSKDWALLRLGDFLSELPKSTLPASCSEANGAYAFYCSSSAPKATDRWLQEQPAILMGTGGVASVHLGKGRYAYSTDTWAIRIKESSKLTQPYVYRVLELSLPKIDYAGFEGSGLRHLRKSYIKDFRFLAPSDSASQRRIVSILDGIDTAIEKTEALIAKYQQIKAGLMHDLFTRGVLPNGQLRPPREQAPELYQETAIGWIPREWEVSGLAAKGRFGTSWIRTGPFGSALKGEHWRSHGHPVITIGALGEGNILSEGLLFVNDRDATRLHDFQLKAGDVVFSRVADVGRSIVVREDQAGWIMSSNLMRIAVDENCARPEFLQMALAGDARVKAQIRARVNSGGRDVANSQVMSQLRFVWPEMDEQDRIIARSDKISRNLNIEQQKLVKLRQQKLGLMQDLLTGKVPVKVGAGGMANG